MKICKTFGINIFVLLCGASLGSAQKWTALPGYPGDGAGPCLVQTDGSVLCNNSQDNTNQWYRLTPDAQGHYLTGTWTQIPNMPYQPIFYASAILPTGQMIIQGGEYLNGSSKWTNQGALWDPASNSWTSVLCNVIASGSLGDTQSVIFPDGTFMIANIVNTQVAQIAPMTAAGYKACATASNCYTLQSPPGKTSGDRNDEEGWTLLPNGTVLTGEAIKAPQTQVYTQGQPGSWANSGSTAPCTLEDTSSQEVGPLVLRPGDSNNPNMTVIGFSATVQSGKTGGCTAIYDTVAQTWSQGPFFPGGLDMADAPASLLPNGNVLAFASPGVFGNGGAFFEWDGKNLNSVPCVPNCAGDSSFIGHMVILPESGQIMFTDYTQDVELYTTSGTYNPAWAPTITGIPFLSKSAGLFAGGTFEIDGLQFNGMAQGAQYGDDLQTATNWPLVRATKVSDGTVYYWKTHDHSTMGVATGGTPVSTKFDIPSSQKFGLYSVQVVANGIPSNVLHVSVCSGAHPITTACL